MSLDALLQESVELQKDDFYSKKFYFSYSSLNKLMYNPVIFHQLYILGVKEERIDNYLVNGKVVHALLLEESKFKDNFIVSPDTLPTANVRVLADTIYKMYTALPKNSEGLVDRVDFEKVVLQVMKEMNYYQKLSTDQQRLDKTLTPEFISYFEFLKTKGSKILIDQDTYQFCKDAVDIIKKDGKLCSLIGCNVTEFDNKEVFNELPLSIDIADTKRPFGLKGVIDNIVIDHDRKLISINDIKTTAKELKDFPETLEFYSYWLQAVIYMALASTNFSALIDQGYDVKFHFVVIDKSFQTYAFPVSDSTLMDWFHRLQSTLDKAQWHYENKSYELPYDFAIGSVTL